jgi:ubiquinone/menaquinone biosynthesis C-methylase UbiE
LSAGPERRTDRAPAENARFSPVSLPPGHRGVGRSYDAVAEEYLHRIGHELDYKPLDRALLAALIEQAPEGPVADLGCGPGHVAAWLSDRHGVSAVGVDISAGMVSVGRRQFPQVEFRHGDLLSLPAADGEFGAVVAFYSIIHLRTGELAVAFEEMRRVLKPAGLLLVAFHAGTEIRHLGEWWEHEVDVDFHFFEPDVVINHLQEAGLEVEARLERMSYQQEVESRRAYLLARRRQSP